MTTHPTPEQAAREFIDAQDELRASYDREPATNADGWPINDQAWLDWRHDDNVPAFMRWKRAAERLDRIVEPDPNGRHTLALRPVAEAILNGVPVCSGA